MWFNSLRVTPLDDVFVLDLSRILSGPFCTMMLGDMGAKVVKVEPPPRGDDTRLWGPPFVNGISTYFLSINRNKRSIGLNLKSPEGRDVLWKLVERADVIVENFRPGVLDKLGFGYDAVSRRNPRIIYASISGYGQTGPYRNRPGYDVVAQGESGIVDLTGEPDRQPVKVGASIADIVAGMYACQGILLAMLARHRTGTGQRIDISLLDGMISTLTYQAMSYFATGRSPTRMGTRHPSIVPYETFETRDGFVNIGAANEKQWQNLCLALGFPDLAYDTRFNTMAGRLDELRRAAGDPRCGAEEVDACRGFRAPGGIRAARRSHQHRRRGARGPAHSRARNGAGADAPGIRSAAIPGHPGEALRHPGIVAVSPAAIRRTQS